MQKILIVAAHPDDEVLGCCGTIMKHIEAGDQVHIMILAEGLTSRKNQRDLSKDIDGIVELQNVSRKVADYLGASSLTMCGFPDNRMDEIALLDVVKKIEGVIEQHSPSIVYTHHGGDVNIDHVITHNAVVTACRPQPGHVVNTLLFFETVSSTEWQPACDAKCFMPNWSIDITRYIEKKLHALHFYEQEMRDWPHSRSYLAVEHLARYRGFCVGVDFAEAFVLGRNILK